MARKAVNSKMFHEPLKKQFIEYKGKTYLARLNALFRKSYTIESKLNKDLYDFDLEEIKQIFLLLNKKTVQDTYRDIKYYLDFCKQQGLIKTNIIAAFSPHYFEGLIASKRFRINEKDFNNYVEKCVNVQDRLILQLLFEGVWGRKNSELLNLKKSDVSYNDNSLNLKCDTNGYRTITVSDKCIELIKLSIKETVFFHKNGNSSSGSQIESYCDNEYVIRSLKRKVTDETKRAESGFIISRFVSFKEWLHPDFTPQAVFKSGMIKYAVDISKKQGISISDFEHSNQWEIVAENFPMKRYIVNGYPQYYSVFQDINEDEIYQLYGNYFETSFKLVDATNVTRDIVEIKKRNSAVKFKKMLLESYNGTCAITGETTEAVLEACHIQDFINEESDHYQNGILLRIDFHRLFDKGLININQDYIVSVSSKVISDYYQRFHGLKITLPQKKEWFPSKEALTYRLEKAERIRG
ncbi:HNH endonuclease [Mesobacillus subterraneus]|uniref:phage lytic cycle repressor MrpR family protein n=1 Tax=Mesobacillus subterraneus TaxID=285983 RepID=UPI00203FB576|nr:HNH endonuclease [Mesobacillus subterraneus]MCM3572516.1 HNH endonuclease [Mesobacillus subterraneus]